jgi:predicted amidophosphoribosyltransferase
MLRYVRVVAYCNRCQSVTTYFDGYCGTCGKKGE